MLKRISDFLYWLFLGEYPTMPIMPIADADVQESLFKKYGYYHNTTLRCDECGRLIYNGLLYPESERQCFGHKKED